ncbi:MAG: methyltransferase family protein [Gammaproteobacteria bacterium]
MNDNTRPSWIVRIPTPIWTLVLLIVAFLAGLVSTAPPLLQNRPIGIALIVAGIALSAWGRLTFRASQAEIFPWSEAHSALVTDGPFRFTRNPMYGGFVVLGIGAALVVGTWLMWLVPIIVFALDNFVIIPFEEHSMERAYGDEFSAYSARVRRWV